MNKEEINLTYKVIKTSKRIGVALFDFLIVLILAITFSGISIAIIANNKACNDFIERTNEIRLSSGLYSLDENGNVKRSADIIEDDVNKTLEEKIFTLKEISFNFYSNEEYFKNGEGVTLLSNYLLNSKTEDGQRMFDDNLNIILKNNYYYEYIDLFTKLINEESLGYLMNNPEYSRQIKTTVYFGLAVLGGVYLLANIIVFYLIPLIFKRGRQTLGFKAFKIGLIDYRGLNCKFSRFSLRFLFFVFIESLLSLATFFLPFAVNLAFVVFSKNKQTLHDYIFATYTIDTTESSIYLDEFDAKKADELKKKAIGKFEE